MLRGEARLNKPAGVDAAVRVQIGDGTTPADPAASVRWLASDPIPDANYINFNGAGTANLNGFNETVGGLSTFGGTATVNTGAGTLGVTSTSFILGPLAFNGNLDLTGGTRDFDITAASSIVGTINNGTHRKTANGALSISVSGNATLDLNGNGTTVPLASTIGGLRGSGALAIVDTLNVDLPAGTNAFAGPLSGAGKLVKTGNGTLVRGTTSNTLAGGVELAGGSLQLTSSNALGAAPPRLTNFRLLDIEVPGSSFARFTHGASMLATFTHIDIGNDALIVDYAGTSPLATYAALVKLKRNSGAWNEIGGIYSELVLADPARLSVGVVEAESLFGPAGGTFRGQSVDGTTLLAVTTLLGDANLDNVVNFDDLLKLASNYNQMLSGSLAGDWALARASVPEPSALVGLAGLSIAMTRRRRMRRPDGGLPPVSRAGPGVHL